jgi:hypothetical protein
MDNVQKSITFVFLKVKISEGRSDIKRLRVFMQTTDCTSTCKQFYEIKNKLAAIGIQISSLLCSER